MKTPSTGSGPSAGTSTLASKLARWRPNALRRTTMSIAAHQRLARPRRSPRASTIIPAQVPSAGSPSPGARAARRAGPSPRPPGPASCSRPRACTMASSPSSCAALRTWTGVGARGGQRPLVLGEGALHRQHPHPRPPEAARRHAHHPCPAAGRPARAPRSRCPAMACLEPGRDRARTSGSSKWVTASTMARAPARRDPRSCRCPSPRTRPRRRAASSGPRRPASRCPRRRS